MGDRVPGRVVQLSARIVVMLGRNRLSLLGPSTHYGTWSNPRLQGRWCWLRRRTDGNSSRRLQLSSVRGVGSRMERPNGQREGELLGSPSYLMSFRHLTR
jgi:hypothetical protein